MTLLPPGSTRASSGTRSAPSPLASPWSPRAPPTAGPSASPSTPSWPSRSSRRSSPGASPPARAACRRSSRPRCFALNVLAANQEASPAASREPRSRPLRRGRLDAGAGRVAAARRLPRPARVPDRPPDRGRRSLAALGHAGAVHLRARVRRSSSSPAATACRTAGCRRVGRRLSGRPHHRKEPTNANAHSRRSDAPVDAAGHRRRSPSRSRL